MCNNEQFHRMHFFIGWIGEKKNDNKRKEKKWKTHKRFSKIHDEMEMNVNNKI